MLHGRNLILAINGMAIAASKSCSIDTNQSFIGISSPTTGRWNKFIPEIMSWKVSSDGLLASPDSYTELLNAQNAGQALTIRYFDKTYGVNQTGTAYIESLSLQGTVGNLIRASVSLRGSGELTVHKTELTPTVITTDNQGIYGLNEIQTTAMYLAAFPADDWIVKVVSLSLDNDTVVEIDPSNGMVIESMSINMAQDASEKRNFLLTDYNAHVYNSDARVSLSSGTHYLILTSTAAQSFDPAIYQLS